MHASNTRNSSSGASYWLWTVAVAVVVLLGLIGMMGYIGSQEKTFPAPAPCKPDTSYCGHNPADLQGNHL